MGLQTLLFRFKFIPVQYKTPPIFPFLGEGIQLFNQYSRTRLVFRQNEWEPSE